MKKYHSRTVLTVSLICLMLFTFGPWKPRHSLAQNPSVQPINAFFLTSVPSDYERLEKLMSNLKDGGANTVIVGPFQPTDFPDMELLPNLVYLAHKAGLRIFFVLPVRNLPRVLAERPEWVDMRYDLGSGTIQPASSLNLFNPDAMDFLVSRFKEIASYSVDGILFGPDFYYGDTEGMTREVLEEYKRRYNSALVMSRAIAKVGDGGKGPIVLEYGEGYREWAELKRDRLFAFIKRIHSECRAINPDIIIGVPLYPEGLSSSVMALNRYAHDTRTFRTAGAGLFWMSIPHRDLRAREGLGYKKGMEYISRTAQAAASTVKEPCGTVIAVQTAYQDNILPLSEIEEVASLVKKSKSVCIALTIRHDLLLPEALTKKIFRGEGLQKQ